MPNEQFDESRGQPHEHPALAQPPQALVEKARPEEPRREDLAQPVTSAPAPQGVLAVDKQLAYLWSVHEYLNTYIRFADTKAGVVIVLASGLIAALYGTGLHVPLLSKSPTEWGWLGTLSAVGFLLLASAVLLAVWAIKPRLTNDQRKGFVFWESIRGFKSPLEYWQALRLQSEDGLTENLSGHLYTLAGVCRRKYFWVALSIWVSVAGAATGTTAILLKDVLT